jgi:hypothetical protein
LPILIAGIREQLEEQLILPVNISFAQHSRGLVLLRILLRISEKLKILGYRTKTSLGTG